MDCIHQVQMSSLLHVHPTNVSYSLLYVHSTLKPIEIHRVNSVLQHTHTAYREHTGCASMTSALLVSLHSWDGQPWHRLRQRVASTCLAPLGVFLLFYCIIPPSIASRMLTRRQKANRQVLSDVSCAENSCVTRKSEEIDVFGTGSAPKHTALHNITALLALTTCNYRANHERHSNPKISFANSSSLFLTCILIAT